MPLDDPFADLAEPVKPTRTTPRQPQPQPNYDPDSALNLISHYESGDQNVRNYRYDPTHTAQGHFQITNTNWRNYGPRAGVDLKQHPSAAAAPRETQANVAKLMYGERGFKDWAPFNPRLRAAIGRGEQAPTRQSRPKDPFVDLADDFGDLADKPSGQTTPANQTKPATKPQGDATAALRKVMDDTNRIMSGVKPRTQPRQPSLIDRTIPNMQEMLTKPDTSPQGLEREAIRKQVVADREGRVGAYGAPTAKGTAALFADPVGTLTGLLKPEDQNISEETTRRLEAAQRSRTPEMEGIRQEYGAMSAPRRALTQPLVRAGAGLLRIGGGAVNPLLSQLGIPVDDFEKWANARATIAEEGTQLAPLDAQGNEVKKGVPEKLVQAASDLGIGIGEIVAMKKATGLPLAQLLALESVAKSSDQPLDKRIGRAGEAYLMGRALDSHLGKAASALAFGAPTAVQTGAQVARGEMSPLDALLQTGVQATAGAVLGGKKTEAPKGETLTQVPDIEGTLAAREARVSPSKEVNVPERPETVAAQLEAVQQGTRPAVLLTKGERRVPIPKGLTAVRTEAGTFYYDPKQVSRETIIQKVADGTHGELLGHVEPKSDATTEAVVARKPDGTEVQASAVSPENAAQQADVMKAQYPEAKIETGGNELAQQVIQDRVAPKLGEVRSPSPQEVRNAAEGTYGGRTRTVNDVVPIDSLAGGVRVSDPAERQRIDDLKARLGSPEGYFERVIVDGEGNVIEGAHRIEALREMGVKDVPVVRVEEVSGAIPNASSVVDQLKTATKLHRDQAQQMVDDAAEIVKGGEKLSDYEAPQGYEREWQILSDILEPKTKPERRGTERTPETDLQWATSMAELYGTKVEQTPEGFEFKAADGSVIASTKTIDETVKAVRDYTNMEDLMGHKRIEPTPAAAKSSLSTEQIRRNVEAEAGPKERVPMAEVAKPTSVETKVPEWVREDIDRKVKEADQLGISDQVEQLSAERLTAKEVAERIAKERNLNPNDVKELVRAVRSSRGIPSMDATSEFETWLAKRTPTPTEVAPTEAPPPVETAPREPAATTGIARRVEEARRGEPPQRGQAVGAAESVERGRQLLNEGADPQSVIDKFKEDGAISAESMALVRAKHEELARVANRAFDEGGLNSPAFKEAEKARQDFWEKNVRPMQTAWSNTGRAQQGETAIDTGTFYGLYRGFKDAKGREPTEREAATLRKFADRSAKADADVNELSSRMAAELDKAAGIQDLPSEVRKAMTRFVDQAGREARRGQRKQTRKTLDDEAVVIKQNLAQAFQKVKSQSGTQPSGLARFDPNGDITKQVIAYAKNRVKAGVTDVAQLVDDVHSTVKDFAADVTKREIAEALLGQGLPKSARSESAWAKTKGAISDALKAEDGTIAREKLGAKLQANPKGMTTEDARAVWEYARENYVDKGNTDFADIRQKVASDLGISPDTVTRALSSTKATKRVSDEMWARMADRRQVRTNAESWVKAADQPLAVKAFEDLRRLFFVKATLGHGAVAPFTHAPVNAFIPSRWATFWPNFAKTYKFMVSKGAHEQAVTDLVNSPNYATAKRAGLANDPKQGYDEYQSPWMAKTLGKLGVSGNRAFDSLKTMRQDMFDSAWNKMAEADRTPEMAKVLAAEVNSSTGASKALSGRDWPSKFVGKAMFAAPLEASRWDFLVRDNYRAMKAYTNWKNAKPEERYMAKRVTARNAQLIGTYGALLAANQGLLMATGSDDKVNFTDPTKSDFLAFKIAGHNISPAGGMLTAIRFVGNLMNVALEDKKPREKAADAARVVFNYGRSKLSPLFGTATDVGLQSDFGGRPLPFSKQEGTAARPRYTWPEYLLSTQTPIPIGEAARDVYTTLREQGMGEEQAKSFLKALGKGAAVGAVAATGVRITPSLKPLPPSRKETVDPMIQKFRSGRLGESDLQTAVDKGTITEAEAKKIKREGSMSVQEADFSSKKPQDALDTYQRLSPSQRERVREIMERKAWSLLYSDSMQGDAATKERTRAKLQRQFDRLGITPKGGGVSGMRQAVQAAFA